MKNKLLLVSCALFLFSGTAFAENLLVTKTSGGTDEEGTLPYVVANAPGGSVIELSIGDETTVTIPETILIDKNLTIDGKGKTISVAEPGVSNYRIFKIGLYEPEDGAELISLTLKNCTLYGGDGTALVDTETTMATWSATILVGANGTLTGENLLFDKAKNGYAAGIMACGDITLTNCTFQNLSGTKAGGALYTNKGVTGRFTNCTFTNNTSEAHGGAVCCSGSTNYFTDCVFTGNTSTGKSTNGGAIFLQNAGASAEIINCTFTENTATNYGGAVEQNNNVTDGALKIVNTTFFVDNKGVHETYGSGIHIASKAIVQIYNSILVRGIGGPDIYTHNDCVISGTHNIYGTALEGTPVTTDEFVDNVVYTDQKLFAEDEPIPALNEGTTKNIAIAADGIAAGAGIVVEGVPTVDQRGKSRSVTNPAIGSYEVEKATSIERVAVEKLFWPNPAQGNINLTEGVSNIAIYDLQGSLVKEVAMPAQSVSVEGLNPGIYLIRITLNGNEHNHRLVIK